VPTLALEERDAMLHENALMLDIDVNHWRNLQTLLLDSAKERRRIVIIHDSGEILKFVHSHREPIVTSVTRVDDPQAAAEKVYDDNSGNVDFVAVFERSAFDEYFGRVQATWKPDEDLDEFVHRTYALLDAYPEGLVTYPGPARNVLGLQWRIGATHEQITDAVKKFVPPGSTVVFGILAGAELWATLVLGFDADLRINVVTTVDPSQLAAKEGVASVAEEVVSWVNRRYPHCSVGLFTTLEHARAFLEREDKLVLLQELAERGELIASPVPDGLQLTTLAAAH
jgi:hypothetical protein